MANRVFFGYPDGRLRSIPIFMGGADDWIGLAEPTTINKRVDTETVVFGTTTVMRERMQIAGLTSGAIAPVSSATGLSVNVTTAVTLTVTGTSNVSGSTVILTTGSGLRVEPIVGATFTVTGTSNVSGSTVVLTTASGIRAEPVVGAVFTVTGTSNVSGSTVVLTTLSAVLVAPQAAATFTVTGTSNVSGSTVVLTTASVVRVESGTTVLSVTGTSNVSGSTVVLTTASGVRVEPVVGAVFTATGTSNVSGSTVILTTASTVSALAAVTLVSKTMWDGTTSVTPAYASISFATSGAQTIVSSAATTAIKVLSWEAVCASTTSLGWRSGTSAITGLRAFAANGGISVGFNPIGLFQTDAGSALILFSETASSVGGSISYIKVN